MRVVAHIRSDKKVRLPYREEEPARMTIIMFERNGEIELLGKFGFHRFFRFVSTRMQPALRQLEFLMTKADTHAIPRGPMLWEEIEETV